MADERSSHPDSIGVDDLRRIDTLCDRFEHAWKSGETPRIEDYLGEVATQQRSNALLELVRIELEHRGRHSQIDKDYYLDRFPADRMLIRRAFELWSQAGQETQTGGNTQVAPVQLSCPNCRQSITLDPHHRQPEVRCPNCQKRFRLTSTAQKSHDAQRLRRLARFDLIDSVGAGGFGTVWKAYDTKLERTVAVKIPQQDVFDPQQRKQFIKEAQSAAQLNHPAIVHVYDVVEDDGTIFIVSKFVEGMTLSQRLKKSKLGIAEAVALCEKLTEALQHAHEKGVVHRDLKPSNVMIDEAGLPHLTDFGLAKREASDVTMTLEGQVLGTPAYMSPEQAGGNTKAIDHRSDIYSLGVILFELLTGKRPFEGSVQTLLHRVIHDDPPKPNDLNPNIPSDLQAVVLKCLSKNPEHRYRTMLNLGKDLRAWLAGEAKKRKDRQAAKLERARNALRCNACGASMQLPSQIDRSLEYSCHQCGSVIVIPIAQVKQQVVFDPESGRAKLVPIVEAKQRKKWPLILASLVIAASLASAAWFFRAELAAVISRFEFISN